MTMRKRAVVSFVLVLVMMGGLMLRVYDLSSQSLRQAAEQQASLSVTVATARGTLYDSALHPLVNTKTQYRISATANPEAIAALAGCVDDETLASLTQRLQQGKPVVSAIDKLPSSANGLLVFETPVRYSGTLIAPHVLGYMDGDGIHGATGAEKVFDEQLNAASGELTVKYTVDAMGKPLEGIAPEITNTLSNARAGVALTIDSDIQKIAEAAAKQYMTKGAVVVMEPDTGRIAAMVSLPDYQLSTLEDSLTSEDSPMINRAFSNYNCGSVFKIVTAAAAIDAGIPLSTSFLCTGSATVGDITFHCHNRLGHGTLGMKDGFAQSCNPYFIQLALRLGGHGLYQMATALGFDRTVIVAEGWKSARAVLPSETELVSPAAVANLSFGQGSLMATPLHIAQLVASVVNGGNVVRPTLLKGTVDADGKLTEEQPTPAQRVYSAQTADTLKQLMIYAVDKGTGASAKPMEGGAGGKTGTAETGWEINGNAVVQGWFGGFYPADYPEYVIVVLAEDTYGKGGKSSPVFKQICEELKMLKTAREPSAADSSVDTSTTSSSSGTWVTGTTGAA